MPATISSGSSGPGARLVPAERLAVVADELLVERRLWAAGRVLVGGPEARGVGRERLVSEHELTVRVDAELELRVGDQDPALGGVVGGEAVELDRDALDLAKALLADERGRGGCVDVLVVALDRLRRGREDRLREPVRLAQPLRQRVARRLPAALVVLPAGAGEVAANDAFDRQHLEPPAFGRAAVLADAQQVVARRRRGVRANQNADSPVSTRPLSGISVGSTTSKVEIRSLATSSRRSESSS